MKAANHPIEPIVQDSKNKEAEGIWLTNDLKVRMTHHLTLLLENRKLRFCNKITSDSITDPRATIVEQLCNFRLDFRPEKESNVAFDDHKVNQKLSGKGSGMRDDTLMALLEACYFLMVFTTEKSTMNAHNREARPLRNNSYLMRPDLITEEVLNASGGMGINVLFGGPPRRVDDEE